MFSYSSVILRVTLFLLFWSLVSGCSTKGSAEFEDVSRYYFGCAMTAPWPLELTSRDSLSVSFIRLDDVYSLPIYFRKSVDGVWPELSDVSESNIVHFPDYPFAVKRVNDLLIDGPGGFDREFVIIIKEHSALILPERSGDDWQALLSSCD